VIVREALAADFEAVAHLIETLPLLEAGIRRHRDSASFGEDRTVLTLSLRL
jgi:hypothetical protein